MVSHIMWHEPGSVLTSNIHPATQQLGDAGVMGASVSRRCDYSLNQRPTSQVPVFLGQPGRSSRDCCGAGFGYRDKPIQTNIAVDSSTRVFHSLVLSS